MASQPFVASIILVVSICLLFIDVSKLHLLWFYSLINIISDFTIGTRAVKKFESFE